MSDWYAFTWQALAWLCEGIEMIDRSAFTWQAFATLLAVVGATVVGWRQVGIAKLQAEISARQAKIAETNLRIQLLDRRSDCVNRMRDIHGEWLQDSQLSDESRAIFRQLLFDSELLYSKSVVAEIEKAVGGVFGSKIWANRSRQYGEQGQEERANAMREKSFAEEDKVMEVMPELLNKLKAQTRVEDWD